MSGDKSDHFKNIFAWYGLVRMLEEVGVDPFESSRESLYRMLSDICSAAQSYTGDDPEILDGYKQVLESIPTLSPKLFKQLRGSETA